MKITMPMSLRKYDTLLLAVIAVILINLAGVTLFFRTDLTKNRAYSLSRASKKTIAGLAEPLTIKVFFTTNLPAPYNTIERHLRDLLSEYSVAGNRFFNYEIYNVSNVEDQATKKNRELALSYGIHPVQVQVVEQDQVKFQQALMGMVLIHGDMVETIPEITSTDGIEYKITSAIRKMANKVSAFSSLKDKVEIKLYFSSSLAAVGPAMNVEGMGDLPSRLEKAVEKLNARYYGKLSFVHLDPSRNRSLEQEAAKNNNILSLQWQSFRDMRGRVIRADRGFAGIIVRHGDRSELINILHVKRIPLFGTQYSLARMDEIEQTLAKTVESVINVNEEIGVLADHGALPLASGGGGQERLANLNKLLNEDYSLKPVSLKDGIPESLPSLIIAGPHEPFSDYDLYQIDQFLMKGKSLAIFLDSFREIVPQPQGGMFFQQQAPYFLPVNTGLEKLLNHYGLSLNRSYVLDESCYKQKASPLFGGGERPLYFAPIIKKEKIAKDVPYLANIKGLVMIKASPVDIVEQKMKDNGLAYARLFSSSDKSWEMTGRIDPNPMFMRPPTDTAKFKSMGLAYMVEGALPSYFADKPVPEAPAPDKDKKEGKDAKKKAGKGASKVTAEDGTIRKGKPGKIFLIGSSDILKDNVIDEDGNSPNAQFVMNVIDSLNNRTDNAIMRTKVQRFNPLKDAKPGVRTLVKTANIAGLPVLVVVSGFIVLIRRKARKRAIQREFSGAKA